MSFHVLFQCKRFKGSVVHGEHPRYAASLNFPWCSNASTQAVMVVVQLGDMPLYLW